MGPLEGANAYPSSVDSERSRLTGNGGGGRGEQNEEDSLQILGHVCYTLYLYIARPQLIGGLVAQQAAQHYDVC